MTEKEIIELLQSKKYRLTNIRKLIINCLFHEHKHTINDFINHIKKAVNEDVNVSSVYNTLEFLVNEGIVDIAIDPITKEKSFELIDKNDFHIHIYDRSSKKDKKIDISDKLMNQIKKEIGSDDICNIKIYVETKRKN